MTQVPDCSVCQEPVLDTEDAYRNSTVLGTATDAEPVEWHGYVVHAKCARNGGGQKVHIWAVGPDFTQVCAKIVQPDGTEIPITSIIRSCTIKLGADDFNTALIEFEAVEFDLVGYTDPGAEEVR